MHGTFPVRVHNFGSMGVPIRILHVALWLFPMQCTLCVRHRLHTIDRTLLNLTRRAVAQRKALFPEHSLSIARAPDPRFRPGRYERILYGIERIQPVHNGDALMRAHAHGHTHTRPHTATLLHATL
jgi:hypothetical protein